MAILSFLSKILGRRKPELLKKKSSALLRLQFEVNRQTVDQELRTMRLLHHKNKPQD